MAEAGEGFDIRRLLLIGGVLVVVIASLLFFLIRGCAPAISRKPGYTQIYSGLDLRDAANAIGRLKELAIPYEIRDDGRAIAVPKDKADQARLGLAEKNLPAGGVVGWEIFDESRLGATDFDRRIQLIRAISGELSRNIRRIEGVEDARVQVVIPETKLFATVSSPVTASVLLRLRPGFELSSSKINGIIHLVASSVENLQPENITVIDDSGKILSAKTETVSAGPIEVPPPPPAEMAPVIITKTSASPEVKATAEVKLGLPVKATAETVARVTAEAITRVTTLTAEEKIIRKHQAKKELEQELSGKTQELLNRFYPPNSIIVKVQVEIKPLKDAEIAAKDLKIKKMYVIALMDNRVDLSSKLKKATFTTIAAAVGYDRKRGDRIVIQKVPFHLATPLVSSGEAKTPGAGTKGMSKYLWWAGGAAFLVLAFWGISTLLRGREESFEPAPAAPTGRPTAAHERFSALDQIQSAAQRNPEKIAEMLKKWLSE